MSRSIEELRKEATYFAEQLQVQPDKFPWKAVVHDMRQAYNQGASLSEVLSWVGLDTVLEVHPGQGEVGHATPEAAEAAEELTRLWPLARNKARSEEMDIRLRDLAEIAVDGGIGMTALARYMKVSRGTVRNLMHPGYAYQTPYERETYRNERRMARRDRAELLG